MDKTINKLSKFTVNNKDRILRSSKCGCYYCISIFDPKEIKNWIDCETTALCPICNIDSVIDNNEVDFDEEFLKRANKFWF